MKMIKNVSVYEAKEYQELIGDIDDVSLKSGVVRVYFRDDDDFGVYVGCEYDDGTFSVVGLACDKFCSYDEMMSYVECE